MELNGVWQVFLGGALGGVLVELVKLGTSGDTIAAKYKRAEYWLLALALWVAGGIVAVINGVDHVPLQRAVQLGIAAPALVSGWATAKSAKAQTRKLAAAGAKHAPYLGQAPGPGPIPSDTPNAAPRPLTIAGLLSF